MGTFDVGAVGAGYLGPATGACLAHVGNRVTLVDADADKVAVLRRGEVPVFEPGLEESLGRGGGRLDPAAAREAGLTYRGFGRG